MKISEIEFKKINDPHYWDLLRTVKNSSPDDYESLLVTCLNKYKFIFNVLPQDLQTKDTVAWCIENEPTVFQNLNQEYITDEQLKELLKGTSGTCYLQWIPQSRISKEICKMALNNNFFNFRYIPELFNPKKFILQYLLNPNIKAHHLGVMGLVSCFEYFGNDIDFISRCCEKDSFFYSAHPYPTVESELAFFFKYPHEYKKIRLVKQMGRDSTYSALLFLKAETDKMRFIMEHL